MICLILSHMGLGSGSINYVDPARVQFLMNGRKNSADHSHSYGQGIFTIKHKNWPRPKGSQIIMHLRRQASLTVGGHRTALAFLVST